jgi:biopolymer transport protein TolQ
MRKEIVLLFALVSAVSIIKYVIDAPAANVSTSLVPVAASTPACFCGAYEPMAFWQVMVGLSFVLMTLYPIAVIVERALTYRQIKRQSNAFEFNTYSALPYHNIEDAITSAHRDNESLLGKVAFAAVQAMCAARDTGLPCATPAEQARQAALQGAKLKLESNLWTLSTIALTLPIVGLFGAAMQLSDSFIAILYAGGNSIWPMASGAANAMEYIAYSLMLAGPTFWMHRYFKSKVRVLMAELDSASSKLVACLVNQHQIDAPVPEGAVTSRLNHQITTAHQE